ncbi:MAG: hypothetical protein NVSMB64_12960 [Candidatus Velthaea sp.]
MGAFAALTIPLDLSRPGAGTLALAAAQSSAGSTGIRIDAARSELHMRLQLPGNITSLMSRLASAGFAIPRSIGVSVPVRSLGIPHVQPDVAHMIDELHASGHVRGAAIAGDQLTASIGPSSKGLYAIYIGLIHSGLMAQDTPTLVALRGL